MMASHNLKRKNSKGLSLFLFPILMITFVLGWCLYIMGDDKKTKGTRVKAVEEAKVQEDNLNIFALPIEEEQEVMIS
jgi:hypothetical protein